MGASRYLLANRIKGGAVPRVRPDSAVLAMEKLAAVIGKGLVKSAHDCSEGGISVSLAEMLFSGGFGAEVELRGVPRGSGIDRDDVLLFSESNSRFIVEVLPEAQKRFEAGMKDVDMGLLGRTIEKNALVVRGINGEEIINIDIRDLKTEWKRPFKELMHENSA